MPDIFFGQNAEFKLISKSHGAFSLGFVESFEVDPSHANKRLYFFNKKEALPITIFEGVNGRFGYLETEERLFLAAVMDVDPSSDMINDDPSAYIDFHGLLNCRNEYGVIKNGIFVKMMRISGVPESMTPREEQHSQVGFIGSTRYKVKGGGILYSRVLAATPDPSVYLSPDDTNFDGTGKVTLTKLPVSINIKDRITTRPWLAIYKNGEDQTLSQETNPTITFDTLTGVVDLGAAPLATDVWEFYTPFKS